MKRPRIGINLDYHSEESGVLDRHQLRTHYAHAVVQAGGLPLLIHAVEDEDLMRDYLSMLDGVVLSGGRDYPPEYYGAEPHPETRSTHVARAFSDNLLGRLLFAESRLPVLGICLGHQLIHIAHGGRMIQHLPTAESHKSVRLGLDREHPVRIVEPGRLRAVFDAERIITNSSHHQAADPDSVPDTLRIVAYAEDGVVEAVEGRDTERFVLGVQWHPERIRDEDHRRRLFAAFTEACRASPASS